MAKIFILKLLRESHKIVIKRTCCCWRGSYKILIQEPPKSLPQELSYKHLEDMASAKSSCKELLEWILPGSPQDLLIRTCARSCKELLGDASSIFTRSSDKDLHKIMQGPPTGCHQDLRSSCSQGPLQDLGQDLHI